MDHGQASFRLARGVARAGGHRHGQNEFAVAVGILEAGLGEGPFILGETFTAADILVANTLAWADKAQVPPESERLRAYKELTLARPALARAQQREAAG